MKDFVRMGLICLLVCSVAFVSMAQEKADSLAHIYGTVSDGQEARMSVTAPLRPTVLLVIDRGDKKDSLYTVTTQGGTFIYRNIPPGDITLRVSCVGRKTIEQSYQVVAGRNLFYFEMEPMVEKLKNATVTAEAPLMKQIGDTTVYISAAVKTMDGESLRSVLEQLPGFNISGTRITVEGEEIKRTYINGVLVFGDNPIVAADALRADEVRQIKVYEEENVIDKRRGLKQGKKEKVLDVVTNTEILHLAQANVLAEGGSDETGQIRYSGAAAAAYHSEMLQIRALGYANNVNKTHNAHIDINDISVTNFLGAGDRLSSYQEIAGAEVYLNKYWKDRNYGNNLSILYNFNHNYGKADTRTLTDRFSNDDVPAMSTEEYFESRNLSGTHNIDLDLFLMDTPLKTWVLGISGTFTDNEASGLTTSETITYGSPDLLSRRETSENNSRNYDIGTYLSWTNNDAQKVRPSAVIRVSHGYSDRLSWTVDTTQTSFSRRNLTSDGFGRNFMASAYFSLASNLINDESMSLSIEGGLSSGYGRSKTKQLTVDELSSYEIDFANSYDNTWNNWSNRLFTSLNLNTRNISMTGTITLRHTLQTDNEAYPVAPYSRDENTWDRFSNDRNYWSVEPAISFKYKKIQINYNAGTTIPSLEQSRNRISDSNPLVLTGGNPDLVQSYNNTLSVLWEKIIGKGLVNIRLNLDGTCNFNQIVQKTEYISENTVLDKWDGYQAQAGAILYSFENSDLPAWSVSLKPSIILLALKRKLHINTLMNFRYISTPQYYADKLIKLNDAAAGINIGISYRPNRKMKFMLNSAVDYVSSRNFNNELLSERVLYNGSASANVSFLKNGFTEISYNAMVYNYLGGVGSDYFSHFLNAEVGWNFLKKTLKISVKGIDLLNSGSTYSSVITADAATQTWTPVYGRYFMLCIKYIFREK